MGVPRVYRTAAEKIIASFDSLDVVTGKGFKRFHCLVGSANRLTGDAVDATNYRTRVTPAGGVTKDIDLNFDIEFDEPAIIEGEAVVNVSYEAIAGGSAANTTIFLDIFIYHVDSGASETQLANNTTATITVNTGIGDIAKRIAELMTIARTRFKKGEKLRVNIEGWTGSGSGTGAQRSMVYHDPTNRLATDSGDSDHSTHDTTLFIDVPFVIR